MSYMMVTAHPNMSKSSARVVVTSSNCWITMDIGTETLTLHGDLCHVDALKMMADIFNETFGDRPDPVPAPAFDATGLDIPYAPEPA